MCTTQIANTYLHDSLVAKGVVPNKSLILEFPKVEWFSKEQLIYHFLRGYCDGDGTLGVYKHSKTNPTLEIFINLNKNFFNDEIENLKEVLLELDTLNIKGIFFYDLAILQ